MLRKSFFSLLSISLVGFFVSVSAYTEAIPKYVQAKINTPVFSTSAITPLFGGKTGTGLVLDEYGQIDPLEFVAFSGTVFSVSDRLTLSGGEVVYRVNSDVYPYKNETGYYIDARFVAPTILTNSPKLPLPKKQDILAKLRSMNGLPYIWGGNISTGIPEMLEWFPPKAVADESLRSRWMLRWVDCSGLLYEATRGNTPRNTSDLVSFGSWISISGATEDMIVSKLRPLDIIAWKGHTIIVLDKNQAIESRASFGEADAVGFAWGGVRIRPLRRVIHDLLATKIPVNSWEDAVPEWKKKFVIRRWFK